MTPDALMKPDHRPRVLVVGGSGYVASLVLPSLAQRFILRVFDRVPPANGSWEFRCGDATDFAALRDAAEGLMQYVRGALGTEAADSAAFALEREQEQVRSEREALSLERAERHIEDLKRRGLIRATEQVETLTSALLRFGVTNVVQFGSDQVRVDRLLVQLLEANGPVIPMGEWAAAAPDTGGASDRLISLARDTARRDGIPYLAAFSQVSAAHPDLARAARDESLNS